MKLLKYFCMKNISKTFQFFIILIILLSFLRIDYRFKSSVECCSDDYDYFIHAETIALDFDLDYTNQNPRDFRYYSNNKNTPIGFIGSGILSAPFLLFGNILSNLFNENLDSEIFNYKIFFYSLSSVFYFLISYFLIYKCLEKLNIKFEKYFLLLIFSGSGVTYFAFERFGMTHVYEVFTISLLIFCCLNFYTNNIYFKYYALLIPFVMLIGFLTRMSNIYLFLLPIIIKFFLKEKNIYVNKKLFFDFNFLISSFFASILYYFLSIELYGELIINPQKIYGTSINVIDSYVSNNLFSTFTELLNTVFIVIFTNEFGIFWVSPIIFIGLTLPLLKLRNINSYLILICFAQNLFIIHIWQSLGSSYGFRYLMSLTPLSILIYYVYFSKNKLLKYYLILFSVLGNLSVLFFETTTSTQLSTIDELNSFGKSIRYIEPNYVTGLINAVFEFNSYLIIFSTSFLGAILFKLFLVLLNSEQLFYYLEKLNLPVDNPDFIIYIDVLNNINLTKFVLVIFIFSIFSYILVNKLKNKSVKF